MQLSIVIPMYNEAENAPFLLAEIVEALEGQVDYEVVMVDDASTDDTPQVLEGLMAEQPRLRVIRHGRNSGQSAAVVTGVRAAQSPWIATLDGDGQNDPADIPALFANVRDLDPLLDVVLIAGNRRKRNDNWLRRLSSRVANGVRQALLQDGCSDTGCGLKVFSRELFLTLPHFNHLHRFLPAMFNRIHGVVLNVPVNHRPRVRGTSKYGVWNRVWVGIVDIFGVRWLQRRAGVSAFDSLPNEVVRKGDVSASAAAAAGTN